MVTPRVTGLDAAFLATETATTHNVIGVTAVFGPRASGPLTRDDLAGLFERRLHRLDPLRRRLCRVPLNLHHPVWIEDEPVDLGHHIVGRAGRIADLPD